MDVEEVKPTLPKKAKAKASALAKAKPEPAATNADEILTQIPDAELPEGAAPGEKVNYFAFKNKQSSIAPSGNAELPDAAPNCLGGLTIVFTGVLPNLDRDTCENVAKQYGAKVTKAISKKTSLVVLGDEAGPAKVRKIKELGTKAIDEAGFIELLRRMPADGGDGASAQAFKQKREAEERKILEDAQAQEQEHKERLAAMEKALRASGSTKRIVPDSEKLWTVKYAPTKISELSGNKGQIEKLRSWLSHWFVSAKAGFKVPRDRDNLGLFRAVLISGPPGIGKTSAAHIVAKELGFDILERNALDVRSKLLLNAKVKSVLDNTSVVGYFNTGDKNSSERRFCLIMDEVDGMSSGDHGGAGALLAFCKITSMPIILICNDKLLPKMRTFDRVALQLPFRRPTETEMRARLLTIAHREKIKLDVNIIGQLVQATGNDIRQIINLMSTVSTTQKHIGADNAKSIADSWRKHSSLKPFDLALQFLGGHMFNEALGSTLNDKIEMYFNDMELTPLMIQENYLQTRLPVSAKDHLRRVASAADSILQLDNVNALIRLSEQQWSLLPFHAVMLTIRPALQVNGQLAGRIAFPAWLGQNSKLLKYLRMLEEIRYHARMRTLGTKLEVRTDYLPVWAAKLLKPLEEQQEEGIDAVIETMDHYYLTKEDRDNILDLAVSGEVKLPTKVKTAFTRRYNNTTHPVAIYHTGTTTAAAVRQKVDFEDAVEDDIAEEETKEEDELDPKKDKLIKEKVRKAKPAKAPAKRKSAKAKA